MKTWNDYKEHVKGIDDDSRKTIEEIESAAEIISAVIAQRNAKGLSQRDLAALCGMPQSSIARIESLKTMPNLDTLIMVMMALDLKLSVTAG